MQYLFFIYCFYIICMQIHCVYICSCYVPLLCGCFYSCFCFQVRTKYESLDGIVPPTHGFMISSTSMKNVWLSMEHQVILWCNQLVIQVSESQVWKPDSIICRRNIITYMLLSRYHTLSLVWQIPEQASLSLTQE